MGYPGKTRVRLLTTLRDMGKIHAENIVVGKHPKSDDSKMTDIIAKYRKQKVRFVGLVTRFTDEQVDLFKKYLRDWKRPRGSPSQR